MKKILLSLFVIGGFLIYVYSKQHDVTSYAVIPTVENNTNNTTPITKQIVSKPVGMYTDGTYTGNSADAYYGNIKVQAVIKDGKLANVIFLDHPQDRSNSVRINNYAMPILKQEAIKIQNANVDTVSGASFSSGAFRESLGNALSQAKV